MQSIKSLRILYIRILCIIILENIDSHFRKDSDVDPWVGIFKLLNFKPRYRKGSDALRGAGERR